jgi:flagellar biosynthesis anti-sigma factor FlgM
MPDPIQGVTPAVPIEVGQTGQSGTPPATAQPSASPISGTVDSADVTRAEALLATITTTAGEVPGVDQGRVAALQQSIQSGAYQANPQQIAQKILELEAMLVPQGGGK